MVCREPDTSQILRNTKTLQAYRARMAAARKASQVYFLAPALFNPAVLIPFLSHQGRRLPAWEVASGVFAYVGLITGLMVLGVYRQRRYLRDHPFVQP